jgi:hypothetical protein
MKRPVRIFILVSSVQTLLFVGLILGNANGLISKNVFVIGMSAVFAVYLSLALPLLRQIQKQVRSPKCPGCGQPLAPYYRGAEPVRYCPKCGTDLEANKPQDEASKN